MTQLHPFLQLTDGTTPVTFLDGTGGTTNFLLERGNGWAPRIASRRRNYLGGQHPIGDVIEDMTVFVRGASTAILMANVALLERLLTQAEAFAAGFAVAPVELRYAPAGSEIATTAEPYRALVLGRPPEDDAAVVELPFDVESTKTRGFVRGVRVRFVRSGAWLEPEEAATPATGIRSYDVATLAFPGGALADAPLRLRLSGLSTTAGTTAWHAGYVVIAPTAAHVAVLEAEAHMTAGTVIGSLANARGGSIRRVTASTTFPFSFGVGTALDLSSTIHLLLCAYVASGTWRVRGVMVSGSTTIVTAWVPLTQNADVDATVVCLPPLGHPGALTGVWIEIERQSTTGQLDVDYAAVAGDARVIELQPSSYPSGASPSVLEIDAAPLAATAPRVRLLTGASANVTRVGYSADAYLTMSGAGIAVGVFLVPRSAAFGAYALVSNTSTLAPHTHTVQAWRRRAVVIAQ